MRIRTHVFTWFHRAHTSDKTQFGKLGFFEENCLGPDMIYFLLSKYFNPAQCLMESVRAGEGGGIDSPEILRVKSVFL